MKYRGKIYWIQGHDSVTCGYFCTGFINSVFIFKSFTYFTNLFPPKSFKKNYEVILNYFLERNMYMSIDMAMVETAEDINMYPQLDNIKK